MTGHSFFSHHEFFQNKEMNEMYLSRAIFSFASFMLSIFVPIYLYQIGYPLWQALSFFLIEYVSFVLLAIPGAKLVSKIGLKHSMLLSVPILIFYYLGLRFIEQAPFLFFILPVALGLNEMFYWYGFHMNYFEHSDRKKRGKELSVIHGSMVAAGALGPFIGGVLISYFGYPVTFTIGSILLFLSMIPLFFSDETYEEVDFDLKKVFSDFFSRKEENNTLSLMGYSVESMINRKIWPLYLIVLLGGVEKVGGLVTASLILALVLFYFIGKITDRVDKHKLLKVLTGLYFFGWLGRLFANSGFRVLIIDSYKNLMEKMIMVPWNATYFDMMSKKPTFEFLVFRETTFFFSRSIVVLGLIAVFYLDFYPFIISFITGAVFSMFYPLIGKDHS